MHSRDSTTNTLADIFRLSQKACSNWKSKKVYCTMRSMKYQIYETYRHTQKHSRKNKRKPISKNARPTLTWAHAGNLMNLATSPKNAKYSIKYKPVWLHYTRTNYDKFIQKCTEYLTNISNQIPHNILTNQVTNSNTTNHSRCPTISGSLESIKWSDVQNGQN